MLPFLALPLACETALRKFHVLIWAMLLRTKMTGRNTKIEKSLHFPYKLVTTLRSFLGKACRYVEPVELPTLKNVMIPISWPFQ